MEIFQVLVESISIRSLKDYGIIFYTTIPTQSHFQFHVEWNFHHY